jgi:hypothetical protein
MTDKWDIYFNPITDDSGNIVSAAEIEKIMKATQSMAKVAKQTQIIDNSLQTAAIKTQIEQITRFKQELEGMKRSGQMSLSEWQAPISWLDGFTAILCELNPDFDTKETTLGHFQDASLQAVMNAISTKQHPQHEKLQESYHDFLLKDKEQRDVYELWYQWDVALQATAKYRPSAFDKVEFYESHPQYTLREFIQWARDRTSTQIIKPEVNSDYLIHVSQEIDAIMRARCDGKNFAHYIQNDQARAIIYERKELAHRIQFTLTTDEADAGLSLAYLEKLIRAQDADGALAQQYIMRVLAPPSPLPPRAYAGGWIDFDDVIKKIGWEPQTTKERREMHAKIWQFVRYGARAHIIGKRTIPYKDPTTGEEINTEIHGAAWRVGNKEVPDSSLYSAFDVPVRAEIILSKELTALITHPKTAQYLEMGEALGSIPGGKPSGAWARVIGMALMSFWRRNPRETLGGTLKPTRRELLDHYTAKVKPYDEILESKDPGRVIGYWCGALGILADQEIVTREGEAKRTAKEVRAALPRQGWQEAWLNETIDIWPGVGRMKTSVEGRAKALPTSNPRNLSCFKKSAKK